MEDVKNKLKEDGMTERYEPEYIVSLMEHTNTLMQGKSDAEKKDFYMNSISDILDREETINKKHKEEVEI